MSDLSRDDCDLILASLSFTRQQFEAYPYPTEEFRHVRLEAVDSATAKVQALRRQARREVRT